MVNIKSDMGNVLLNDCEIEKGNVQTDSGDMFFKNCDFDDLKVNTDMGTLCFIGKEAVMRAWNVQVDTEMGNINAVAKCRRMTMTVLSPTYRKEWAVIWCSGPTAEMSA